jgi:hypothetical protein
MAYPPLLLTGDQKLYLSEIFEMWDRGQFLHAWFQGAPSFIKPPLLHWLVLLSWKLFGITFWSTLLPSSLALIGTGLLLTSIGRRVSEGAHLPTSSWIFSLALGTLTFGSVIQMEIFLCLLITASWAASLKFLELPLEARQWRWAFLALALAGMLSWVKSPAYSIVWVGSWMLYLLLSGEWEVFLDRRFGITLLCGIAVGLTWYLAVYGAGQGNALWNQMFVYETFAKRNGNGGTVSSLWWSLGIHLLPFTFIALVSIPLAWKARRTAYLLELVISWVIPLGILFSIHPYRVSTYLYPLVPAFALLTDWALQRVHRRATVKYSIRLGGAVLFLSSLILASLLGRTDWISGLLDSFWILFALAIFWPVVVRANPSFFIFSAFAFSILFRFTLIELGAFEYRGLIQWTQEHPQTELALWEPSPSVWTENGWLRLTSGSKVAIISQENEIAESLNRGRGVLLPASEWQRFQNEGKPWANPQLKQKDWDRFKTRREFPFDELFERGFDPSLTIEGSDDFIRHWKIISR